jgi:hypothetical protein
MKRFPHQHVISCAMCENFSVDVSPWISCRVLTWPRPIAHLMFLVHRRRRHRLEYSVWRAEFKRKAAKQ